MFVIITRQSGRIQRQRLRSARYATRIFPGLRWLAMRKPLTEWCGRVLGAFIPVKTTKAGEVEIVDLFDGLSGISW
jgi:hypothetical protein